MKKLAIAAIVAAVLATATSAAALYRTRDLSSPNTNSPSSTPPASSAGLVEVPDLTNTNLFQAGATLIAVQLKFKFTHAPSDTVAKNSVISQNPAATTPVAVGTVIELTVSDGPT